LEFDDIDGEDSLNDQEHYDEALIINENELVEEKIEKIEKIEKKEKKEIV
jgi:phosphoglycerol transferase MdoB-like AlkP superfamily enzyme